MTITIWGFGPRYHVTGSRDEKTDTTTEFLESEIPHNEVQTDSMGTFEITLSPGNLTYI